MNLDFFNFLQPIFWVKIIALVVIGFYVIFTFVVFTQVKVMSDILHVSNAGGILRIFSIIHILLAISLFFLALAIL